MDAVHHILCSLLFLLPSTIVMIITIIVIMTITVMVVMMTDTEFAIQAATLCGEVQEHFAARLLR